MEIGDLTSDEIALSRRAAARAFQRRAIATAHAFVDWSAESGEGLTFSTFINTFGYQENDGNQMYEAVELILEAAKPL